MSYRHWTDHWCGERVELYLVGSQLYVELESHMFQGMVSRPCAQIEVLDYLWHDPHFHEGVRGVRVLIDGQVHQLSESASKDQLLSAIPDGNEHELLAQIESILAGQPVEPDYQDRAIEKLTRLTLQHARLVKIIQDQPQFKLELL